MGGAVSLISKPKKRSNSVESKTDDPQVVSPAVSSSRLDIQQERFSPRSNHSYGSRSSFDRSIISPSPNRSPLTRLYTDHNSPIISSPPPESVPSAQSNHDRPMLSHRSEESEGQNIAAEVFAQTAMSLGLDGDDLLFNMMFFDDGNAGTFGQLLNTMQQETLALHSEHNTPYRLHPADEEALAGLHEETFEMHTTGEECECLVCRDEIENGAKILRIPACKHYFHDECLLKWAKLQAWCPVCRTSLETNQSATKSSSHGHKPHIMDALTENTSSRDGDDDQDRTNNQFLFPSSMLEIENDRKEQISPITRKLLMEESLFGSSQDHSLLHEEDTSLFLADTKIPTSRHFTLQVKELKNSGQSQPQAQVKEESRRSSRYRQIEDDDDDYHDHGHDNDHKIVDASFTVEHQIAKESTEKILYNAIHSIQHKEVLA